MATIRKRESKDGTIKYRIDVKYFDDKENKIRCKSITFYPPKGIPNHKSYVLAQQEAERFEKSIFSIINSNHPSTVDDLNIIFKDFALDWLNNSKIEKGITYYEEKKGKVEYLINEIGKYRVKDLTPAIIQDMFNRIDSRKKEVARVKAKDKINEILLKHGWNYKKLMDANVGESTYMSAIRGNNVSEKWAIKFSSIVKIDIDKLFIVDRQYIDYAFETNLKIKKTLHLILGRAVKYGIVDRNYSSSEFIDYPKVKKTKIDVMNDQEIKIFYDTVMNMENIETKTALLLALLTGLRRGEIAGLRWDDINFDEKTITVNRSIRRSIELGQFIKDPKTESSNRTFTMPDELYNQLIKYKKWQDEKNEKLKKKYNKDNYVFTDAYGEMSNLDRYERMMKKALKKANLSHHTLHSLRHTNISLQIAAGVPIVTVASRAGHSRTSTTTDIYAYSLNGADKNAAKALDNIFEGKKIDKNIVSDSNDDSLLKFKQAREEMKKLGFQDMDEYLDYIKYMKHLNEQRKGEII